MGSSKPATTTVNQVNQPYAPAMPALQNILDQSKAAFNSGVGSQVYQGERVAHQSGDTLSAMDQIRALASQGPTAATQAGTSFNNGLINNGGMSAGTQSALSQLQGVGGIDNAALQRLLSGYGSETGQLGAALGQSATERNLSGVARGDYLDPSKGNPYLDALINQGATDAANNVAAKFSGSGRYGSAAFGGAIADATGKIATQTRAAQYDAERQRQAEANAAIDAQTLQRGGLQQSQTAQQLAALGQLAGQQQFNSNLGVTKAQGALTANQNATQSALAAIGNIPMLNDQAMNPAQTLMQLGTFQDAYLQDRINADQQKFADDQNAPWKQLGLYQAAALPIAQTGSQTNGTTVQQAAQPSGLQTALGTGLSAVGLLGKLFSDERLKEDIEKVGKLDNGQNVYAYRYKDGGPRQIGLLAQEVEKDRPEAVGTHPSGFKMVDYDLATSKKRVA